MMKTVLFVDDSQDTREMYAVRLRGEGYRVIEAGDGRTGVDVAIAERPDLIFMNLALPEVDGLTAIALLREDPRTATIPIIALTGFDEESARDQAEEAGCSGFIEKPLEPSRLAEEVRQWLGPAARSPR